MLSWLLHELQYSASTAVSLLTARTARIRAPIFQLIGDIPEGGFWLAEQMVLIKMLLSLLDIEIEAISVRLGARL